MTKPDFIPSLRMTALLEALDHADAIRSTANADLDAGKDADYDVALKACWDALDAIAAEPAGSIGDLIVKAKAFDWSARLVDGEAYNNPSDGEEKIMRQLVAGLVGVSL